MADAVWTYPNPLPGYEALAGYLAFYPGLMEACLVDTGRRGKTLVGEPSSQHEDRRGEVEPGP